MKLLMNQRGSALVEVAIMLPIIMMLVFGFIQFTTAIRINTVLQMAAREGARKYAVTENKTAAMQKTKDELKLGGINPSDTDIFVTDDNGRRVIVEMPIPIYIPFAGGKNYKIKGDAVFHTENNLDY